MNDLILKFYSVLKNEDAMPYVGGNILVAADGLGGSGSTVHAIDRKKHNNLRDEIMSSAFDDMTAVSPELERYIDGLIEPMIDGKDDTSALWASRIVIARCVYALTEGKLKDADLSDEKVRCRLAEYIFAGLRNTAKKFGLQKGKYDGQLVLPTTLALVRYSETESTVVAESVWAGDSRCYALTPNGLKLLSIDDENDSGAITNLFQAEKDNVVLNYLRHEIAKPCVLMAVSDGVFDPFDPHDYLEVEHTLLSAIAECNSTDELANSLKTFYDGVHGDDATMAFVPFGFSDYKNMKNAFAKRTEKISAMHQKQYELYDALEVLNQTEEEAAHYVQSRTRDKYDNIACIIADAIENNSNDLVITVDVKRAVDGIKKDIKSAFEKVKKQNRERALKGLYEFVKNHPELAATKILNSDHLDSVVNLALKRAFGEMKKSAAECVSDMNGNEAAESEKRLSARCEELHIKIMERIKFHREKFDSLWDSNPSYTLRSQEKAALRFWQDADFNLQYDSRLSHIENLPQSERPFAREVDSFIDKYKQEKRKIRELRAIAADTHNRYVRAWDTVCNYIKSNIVPASTLLCPEILTEFGLDADSENTAAELGKDAREKIIGELKNKRDIIVPDLVKALAAECNKTSIIDDQYNATKLELFRTYYRLKALGSDDIKAFKAQLATLEADYMSLVTK